MTKPIIFIDGEAGTTGLEIRKRLEGRTDLEMVSIAADKRKDAAERKRLLNAADVAILCLPDDAAREAVALIDNPETRVLDASTAYRVAPDWAYGFPELTATQADKIREASRVSNPGCYPTGMLGLIRPLTEAGLIPADYAITVNAISGYSGGGKDLIAVCEDPASKGEVAGAGRAAGYCLYGIEQKHKHLPEMRIHGGLTEEPIFLPSYSSSFYRGMLVQIALRGKELSRLTGKQVTGEIVHAALEKHYTGQKYVWVEELQAKLEPGYVLTPLAQNETNNLQLRVFWNAEKQTLLLTACLDNLGKGASGAAVQNLELMLGLNA